jgi:Protein of unknown function (DUF3108)
VRPLLAYLFSLALCTATFAAPPLALKEGESLEYRVDWAVIPSAGSITIRAKTLVEPNQPPRLSILTETATRNIARALLKFNASSESLFDIEDGRLITISESSYSRGKKRSHTVTFSYKTHTAIYKDDLPKTLSVPEGYPTDLITCLLNMRNISLHPGESHEALVLFDNDFYDLTIHALNYEEIKTPLGTFRTLVLEPRMDHSPAKGMFKKGTTVRVWISQDANPLPVRFRVNFKVGIGTASLVRYTPPKLSK